MKKLLSILLAGMLSFGMVACGESKDTSKKDDTSKPAPTETKKEEPKKEEKKEPIEAFKEELKKAGLNIGENSDVFFEMVGATSGQKIKVNDQLLEIYYYDESKLTEEGKKLFEQAKKGNIDMSGINLPVVYKNNFALARVSEHKDKDKILEVFNSFNY